MSSVSDQADIVCRAIKRIIFESVSKFNGSQHEVIEDASLKQIAGRAGRYRTAAQAEGGANENATTSQAIAKPISPPSLGLVTTLETADLPVLRKAMQTELSPIMSAGIFPPTSVLTKFATYFPPSTSFSYILLRLHELSMNHPRYHLCNLNDQTAIADSIQPVSNLTIHDRIVFCASPAYTKGPGMRSVLQAFARCVGEHSSGALLDIPELDLEVLGEETKIDRSHIERLESLHRALILYLWLSYRFAGVFVDQTMAIYVKKLVEERIDTVLAEYSASPEIRERIRKMREDALMQISKLNEPISESDDFETQRKRLEGSLVPDSSSAYEQSVGI
jgi:ATP-dependent RNA helicase SUPV3L1/SUV3